MTDKPASFERAVKDGPQSVSPHAPSADSHAHYDEAYYRWYEPLAHFSGEFNRRYFAPFVRPTDRVLDFGCGSGYLLAGLNVAERAGIEVSPHAAAVARRNGLTVYAIARDVPEEWADILISQSALEHVDEPLTELRRLYRAVKPGGRVVVQIPHEIFAPWYPNDRNQHLYTWSPMCAGNLFTKAGFVVDRVEEYATAYPPLFFRELQTLMGGTVFYQFCRMYGRWIAPLEARIPRKFRRTRVHLKTIRLFAHRD